MGENRSQNKQNTEYVLSSLTDDEDTISGLSEYEKKPEDYETTVLKEITDVMDEIENINDKISQTTDKLLFENYAEYLLQLIIKLDNIDGKNFISIREARKDAILYAQGTLQKLDEKMEVNN